MNFWVIAYMCTAQMCSSPERGYDPATSLYATESACKLRLSIATLPAGIEGVCVGTDTVTLSEGRFSPYASLLVNRMPQRTQP